MSFSILHFDDYFVSCRSKLHVVAAAAAAGVTVVAAVAAAAAVVIVITVAAVVVVFRSFYSFSRNSFYGSLRNIKK